MAHLIHGFELGGLERVVLELSVRGATHGVSSTVVSFGPDGPLRGVLQKAGVPVVWVREGRGLAPRTLRAIRAAVRTARADVVHAHDVGPWVNAVAGARLGACVPVVVTVHQTAAPSARRRLLATAAAPLTAAIVACAPPVAAAIGAWGLRGARIRTIENGVALGAPPDAEARARARAALGAREGQLVVGYLGRLSEEKGPDLLVDAFAARFRGREGVRLALVGDGPMREALRARAGAGVDVAFLGAREDGRALLAGFDVYAQPSRREGLSLALLEAMATGLPTVATRIPQVETVHRHEGTALLCEAGDVHGIGAALARLAGDPAERARLGAAARVAVARYDVARMVDAYAGLYRELA